MALKIYFLRHGETTFSRDDMYCGSGTDAQLTDEGRTMAEQFGKYYATFPWDALYASPLSRTHATVKPIAAATGLEVRLRDDLKEIFYGEWEGKTRTEIDQTYGDELRNWLSDPGKFRPTGGETAVEVAARGMRVVAEIQKNHQDGNVLAVSHKATIRLIVCALLGIELKKYRVLLDCPVASVTVIEFKKTGPMLLAFGDRSHLDTRLRSLPGT